MAGVTRPTAHWGSKQITHISCVCSRKDNPIYLRLNSGKTTAVYSEKFGEYVLFQCSKLATAALGQFPCWRAEETTDRTKGKVSHLRLPFFV